jgi:transglutaminase-like putative cysteine protease
MLQVERLLQIAFLLLICTSGLLLAFSQREFGLAAIAIISAFAGLVFCDWLKWIELKSWVANILSIAVLFFAMRTFFAGDTGGQLMAVANLLVYLQMVLLFQKKSPRLYWQISVLSLLQVVVATIFNMQFEGGLFFVGYMLLAGAALTLLTIYHQGRLAQKSSQSTLRKMEVASTKMSTMGGSRKPMVAFDQTVQDNRVVRKMLKHLLMWVFVSLVFASILFYEIPRTDSAWFGPRYFQTAATGANKALELDERGRLTLGSDIVMRVKFSDPKSGKNIQVGRAPYFRGMALSSLKIKDGKTDFVAPYDRVYGFLYEKLRDVQKNDTRIDMEVTLEATNDPLIYVCMPARLNSGTAEGIEFCHEISAMTRKRQGARIEMSPLKYSVSIPSQFKSTLPRHWAYEPESMDKSGRTMDGNPGQKKWLTYMDPERYPELVQIAKDTAKTAPRPSDTLSVSRQLQQYFLLSREFNYTLDFRDIERDEQLDPIEDFMRNHKSGHCSLYAASLCLMLRSQGIPARVVVGFLGGSYNDLGEFYLVTEQHAHAWVEAYIPPRDCSDEMKLDPRVAERGAWLTLDATPESAIDFSAGEDALDLARTLWQDYVLGLDDQTQGQSWMSGGSVIGLLDMSTWGSRFESSYSMVKSSPLLSTLLLIGVALAMALFTYFKVKRGGKRKKQRIKKPAGRFRRFLGNAISVIAPNLGTWLIHGSESNRVVAFYEKLVGVLRRHGHVREANQTHREFADAVSLNYQDHPAWNQIDDSLKTMTDLFNLIRFGSGELSNESASRIEGDMAILDAQLSAKPHPKSD